MAATSSTCCPMLGLAGGWDGQAPPSGAIPQDMAQGWAYSHAHGTHLRRATLVHACLGQRSNELPELVQAEAAQGLRADVAA